MILKGSQRASGQDLARHLLRTDENEHVRVHELRGFAADDLPGAFREAEAVARGTKCKQYLFSLSLSPPADAAVPVDRFEAAIEGAEAKLGLTGQPRAIVFHEKDGRRHAHCVWSRIDAETMTARPMSFFKSKLTDLSRDLYLDHGWRMPDGLLKAGDRDPTNFSLAEWQQAKRLGQDPRWIKQVVQGCWQRSDNAASFGRALEEHGYFLARGDRRGHVVIGHDGEVHALSRALGLKAKEVTARLGKPDGLAGVEETQGAIARRMTPAIRRHIEEQRTRFREGAAKLGFDKAKQTDLHRDARKALDARLAAEWIASTKARTARLPTGFASLWARLSGRHRELRRANEAEALRERREQKRRRQTLIEAQRRDRTPLLQASRDLRARQATQLAELRREVGRYLAYQRQHEQRQARTLGRDPERGRTPDRSRGLGLGLER